MICPVPVQPLVLIVATQRASQCIATEGLVKSGGWNKATMEQSDESQP
jgi:hypothetical protein